VSHSRLKKEDHSMTDSAIVPLPPAPAPETLPVELSAHPPQAPRLTLQIEALEERLAPGGAPAGVMI
jgi:hypothetical protein